MPFEGQPIHLTDAQRDDLEEIARSKGLPVGFGTARQDRARRPRPHTSGGDEAGRVATDHRQMAPTVPGARRRRRDQPPRRPAAVEVDGPGACPSAGRHAVPTAGRGRLTGFCRRLAHIGVSNNIVQRVWREADLRPHGLALYMASNDPRLRDEGGPHHRSLPGSAPSRRGVLHRGEVHHSSPRPAGPRAAALAGPGRPSRVRVQSGTARCRSTRR